MSAVSSSPSTPDSTVQTLSRRDCRSSASRFTFTTRFRATPHNVPLIVSDEGYGKNEYIETTRPLVVVTAPGPGSGKMATCLSQLYHEHKRGVNAHRKHSPACRS